MDIDNDVNAAVLTDDEIKSQYGLEYLTTISSTGTEVRKIGFARGKLVTLEVNSSRCTHVETQIGDSLYELFKSQAVKGKYDSVKEFITGLELPKDQYDPIDINKHC